MRSIEILVRKIQERRPDLGTFTCLMMAVKGHQFSRKSLGKAFKKIMPESEYETKEMKVLIDNLERVTKPPEEVEK